MRTNPKVILAAIGVAALLASSAIAKTAKHHQAAPSIVFTGDARRPVAPCGYGSFDNPVNPPCREAFGFCTC